MHVKNLCLTSLLVSLSCFSNAALILDTAIISYEDLGYFGFKYTGDSLFHEDGYDFNGSEVFEADFGDPSGNTGFDLITIAMDIEDLIYSLPYIRLGGPVPGELDGFGARGTINGSACRFGENDGSCTDSNGNITYYEAQLFATYNEVLRPASVGVSEPSVFILLVAGFFALGLSRRKKFTSVCCV